MTCYFRWMKDVFEKAEIEINKDNKKEVDRKIHSLLGVKYKNCSDTWKRVKERLAEDEEGFINALKEIIK